MQKCTEFTSADSIEFDYNTNYCYLENIFTITFSENNMTGF